MKLLGYCLFCLFAARVQSKPQITKLFPVEGITYQKQLNNTTKPLEKFWGKLRATYNFIFRQTNNTNNIEKILAKDAPASDLQALKLIWPNSLNTDRYSNLQYPNNSFLDQIKSLSILKKYENKANSSNLEKESSIKIATTVKANERNVNSISSDEKNSNKTKTLPDNDWFNDIQPLEQLELQDEEINKKNEVEIITATTTQSPTRVGHQLVEWLGSLFSLTHNIYAKLSSATCGKEKTQ
ncbi:uncharacterized protein LOC115239449 [Formica exsecta]|uniref:uncharacterized protein LOC115239449 n=1 Tax=Formica exsecta TaxID=72781 RepID=UPI00114293D3|nr:uncharacterized protein LOC115239449 [Formica exsecta]